MADNIQYTRKSLTVQVKLKVQSGKLQKWISTYPSSLADSYPLEQYQREIWPQECLIVNGHPVNCKGLIDAMNDAIIAYIEKQSAEQTNDGNAVS